MTLILEQHWRHDGRLSVAEVESRLKTPRVGQALARKGTRQAGRAA